MTEPGIVWKSVATNSTATPTLPKPRPRDRPIGEITIRLTGLYVWTDPNATASPAMPMPRPRPSR